MKSYNPFFMAAGLIMLLYSSCERDDQKQTDNNPPEAPQDFEIDVNNDQVTDFKIAYNWFTYDGLNVSGDGIQGCIFNLYENQILCKKDTGCLFGQESDTIRVDMQSPYFWSNSPAFIVTIMTRSHYQWDKEWSVTNRTTGDFYYIAVLLKKEDKSFLGWIKLTVDKKTGKIEITDKKLSDSDILILGK